MMRELFACWGDNKGAEPLHMAASIQVHAKSQSKEEVNPWKGYERFAWKVTLQETITYPTKREKENYVSCLEGR